MNLTADLKDKARQLLGGKNVTKKRLEKLLEEVEQARREKDSPVSGDDMEEMALRPLHPPVEPPLETAGQAQADEQKYAVLLAQMAKMQAKIEELTAVRAADDKDQAIASGKLPVSAPAPPPLGYTGSAQLPRGEWFVGPFGPQIEMKLCECEQCQPTRFRHYYCVVCRSGPHDYTQRLGGSKNWMAPGSAWGLRHDCCSILCWSRYEEMTAGRAPVRAINLPEPRHPVVAGESSGAAPERPVRGAMSD